MKKYFEPHLNSLCEDCNNRFLKNPLRILDCKVDHENTLIKNAPSILDYLNDEEKEYFKQIQNYLDKLGVDYVVDSTLVRGLDYYSHTVFELEADVSGLGSTNVVGGGGRYNELVSDLEGPQTPCVGMAFGVDRLIAIMENNGYFDNHKEQIHAFLITLGDKAKLYSQKLLFELRMAGITLDTDYLDKGLKGQFKQADSHNAMFTLILGDDELAAGKINVKNNETKEQETIELTSLRDYLYKKLEGNSCKNCNRGK